MRMLQHHGDLTLVICVLMSIAPIVLGEDKPKYLLIELEEDVESEPIASAEDNETVLTGKRKSPHYQSPIGIPNQAYAYTNPPAWNTRPPPAAWTTKSPPAMWTTRPTPPAWTPREKRPYQAQDYTNPPTWNRRPPPPLAWTTKPPPPMWTTRPTPPTWMPRAQPPMWTRRPNPPTWTPRKQPPVWTPKPTSATWRPKWEKQNAYRKIKKTAAYRQWIPQSFVPPPPSMYDSGGRLGANVDMGPGHGGFDYHPEAQPGYQDEYYPEIIGPIYDDTRSGSANPEYNYGY